MIKRLLTQVVHTTLIISMTILIISVHFRRTFFSLILLYRYLDFTVKIHNIFITIVYQLDIAEFFAQKLRDSRMEFTILLTLRCACTIFEHLVSKLFCPSGLPDFHTARSNCLRNIRTLRIRREGQPRWSLPPARSIRVSTKITISFDEP